MVEVETPGAEHRRGISGRVVVVCFTLACLLWIAFLLVGSPRVQEGLGIGGLELPTPPAPREVVLVAEAAYTATARWDELGVCVQLAFADDAVTRTCAAADPLRPLWGIDVPDAPVPLVVVATAPAVHTVVAQLDTGVEVTAAALGGGDGLPAAFAILRLPPATRVERLRALAEDGEELTVADCPEALDPTLPNAGCSVPVD